MKNKKIMLNSNIKDINGTEIKAGDTVELTINLQYQEPLKVMKKIIFEKGAFRFHDENEALKSCIGDIGHNCTMEVLYGNGSVERL